MTKKQKVYGVILGVGLAAVAVDQMWLSGGPAEAAADLVVSRQASAAPQPGPGGPAAAVVSPTAAAAPPAAEGTIDLLAQRLRVFGDKQQLDPEQLADAFRPAASWLGPEAAPAAPATPAGAKVKSDSSRSVVFAREHQLSAVMGSESSGLAVVDGTTLRVGQSIAGFKLLAVERQAAIFEADGEQAVLRLAQPTNGTGQ